MVTRKVKIKFSVPFLISAPPLNVLALQGKQTGSVFRAAEDLSKSRLTRMGGRKQADKHLGLPHRGENQQNSGRIKTSFRTKPFG